MRTMKRSLVILTMCALAVALAAPVAFAQDPTNETYNEETPLAPNLLQDLEGPPPSVSDNPDGPPVAADDSPDETQEAAGETLPFTGLDVALVALMGAALVGTGVAMRRSVRGPQA